MFRISLTGLLMGMATIAAPTFNKDVLPILQKNCQSCHRPGEIGPMSLLTYQEARPWAKAMKAAVVNKKMPPWFADPRFGHFSNERKLTESEMNTLAAWAENGAPEGNAKDKPAPVRFPDGWNIVPNKIFEMRRAVSVPAQGVVDYTYIVIPTGFTEDTWVSAAEVRPGSRSVVHHVIAFVRPPDSQWMKDAKPGEPFIPIVYKRDENGAAIRGQRTGERPSNPDPQRSSVAGNEFLVAYVPGIQPQDFRTGDSAKLIPAGSDIVLQMHYTPNGKPFDDVTRVGLVLAKE